MENKLKFLSGPHLEKSWELGCAQQAGMDRMDTRLEEGGGPGPKEASACQPWSHFGEGTK